MFFTVPHVLDVCTFNQESKKKLSSSYSMQVNPSGMQRYKGKVPDFKKLSLVNCLYPPLTQLGVSVLSNDLKTQLNSLNTHHTHCDVSG